MGRKLARRLSLSRARIALAVVCLGVVLIGQACRRLPAPPATGCLADSLGPLNNRASRLDCADADACRRECRIGSAGACLGLATRLDLDPKTAAEAQRLFERACVLGSPSGCTNTAAMIWTSEPSDEETTCAMRLFERACQVKEHFACGMVPRLLLQRGEAADVERAHNLLVKHCEDLKGFPCRVLAKHLEAGDFGAVSPERIRTLLARACDGGDPDACGDPPTAAGTFR